jgi:regulation of enolase protein 1 (concanavalin A-like superfamily)
MKSWLEVVNEPRRQALVDFWRKSYSSFRMTAGNFSVFLVKSNSFYNKHIKIIRLLKHLSGELPKYKGLLQK